MIPIEVIVTSKDEPPYEIKGSVTPQTKKRLLIFARIPFYSN